VPKLDLIELQRFLPARVKYTLKPYYRKIFSNKLIVLLNPTWRCNYRCSYCCIVTKFAFTSVVPRAGERTGEEWINGLDKLPSAAVYICGGEPFVYADIAVLVNRLPEKHSLIGIVTNLSQPASVYRKIEKRIHLNASFHREHTNGEEFLAKIKELSPHFHIQVNIVATPENLLVLEQISGELGESAVELHVDPYVDIGFHYSPAQLKTLHRFITPDRKPETQLDFDDFSPKRCSAGRNYVNFAPDGSAYTCQGGMNFLHSPLHAGLAEGRELDHFRLGNLFDADFRLNSKDVLCSMPCNIACDRDSTIISPEKLVRP
jgi:MoaA/NifB/PqqE/SkfB family radical SAM enzyme